MNQQQGITEAGTLDTTFGVGGAVGLPFEGTRGKSAAATLEVAEGKLLIVEDPQFSPTAVLRRLNTDGTLDETFGNGGSVDIRFEEDERFSLPVLRSHPAGGWILTGQLLGGSNGFVVVVRQFEDGTLDDTFGDNGILRVDTQQLVYLVTKAPAGSLAKRSGDPKPQQRSGSSGSGALSSEVMPDGKIVLIDVVSSSPDLQQGILVRLNPDGSLDKSFNGKGFTLIGLDGIDHQYSGVKALAVQKDGKIVLTGTFQPRDGDAVYEVYVTRYMENGQLDSGFANKGIATIALTAGPGLNNVNAIAVRESNDAIAIVGELFRERLFRGWVCVLNPNGSPNLVFNDGKTLYSAMLPKGEYWQYCAWPTNSALLVAGSAADGPEAQIPPILIARYQADGALDPSFNKTGWAVYTNPEGSPALSDGLVMQNNKIVVCGEVSPPTGPYRGYILRYNS